MNRIILHIDMDAYFASVAQAVNPELKGKPIVIGGENKRGIVSTASYEARKYGIHSAMPMYQARNLCMDLIIINPDFELYKKYTYYFVEIIKKYSRKIEMFSIDECFVDMTETLKNDKNPLNTIANIQREIKQKLDLSCSIGIASNKFLAKIASDLKKPYGISIIRNKEIQEKLWPLPIEKMFGIGKKTAPLCIKNNIKTIGDLACFEDEIKLKNILGNNARTFKNWANGVDDSEVKTEQEELKSLGHERTFEEDITDINILLEKLKDLSKMVSKRAQDLYLEADTVQLTLKYSDFRSITRSKRMNRPNNNFEEIFETAALLLEENYHNEPVRLIGVALKNTNKINNYNKQLTLFDIENYNKEDELRNLISKINKQIGKDSLKTAREAKK